MVTLFGEFLQFSLSLSIYIYIYIYEEIKDCNPTICRKTDNNDLCGRNDLLRGRQNSVSVLLNHHQVHEGVIFTILS